MAFKFSSVKPAAKPAPNACEVTNDVQIPDGPSDTVSALSWSPTADFLAVSSWDNSVRVYEVGNPIQGRASYSHEGPALDVCWSGDGTKILSGGADNAGRMFDVQTGQPTQVAQHQAPIKSVRWTDMHGGLLVTGSWDKTIKFWDLRTPTPIGSIDLPDKVFAMDLAQNLLVIASGGYKLCLVDLNKPTMLSGQPIDSPLKFQTRCVAVTPTASGYTVGGVEGRVAVQWTVPSTTPGNYSFRCHRVTGPLATDTNTKESQIFAVNTMAMHPVHGSCLTGGGDSIFSIWDIVNKRLLKNHELKPAGSTAPLPVVASAFNKINGGNILAYAVGYDWSHGYKGATPNQPNKIMLHSIKEEEVKPRPKV